MPSPDPTPEGIAPECRGHCHIRRKLGNRGADVLMGRYFDGVIYHCLSTNTSMGLALVRYLRDRARKVQRLEDVASIATNITWPRECVNGNNGTKRKIATTSYGNAKEGLCHCS